MTVMTVFLPFYLLVPPPWRGERSASWPGLAPVPVSSTRPGHSCDQNVFLNLMNWSLEDLYRTEAADRRRDGHCLSRDLVTGDGGPGPSPSGQSVPNSSQ